MEYLKSLSQFQLAGIILPIGFTFFIYKVAPFCVGSKNNPSLPKLMELVGKKDSIAPLF